MASLHPTVSEYYTDKNVFITGATGFIGKVLLEKLLRSCPNVGNLYLLVRPKKSQDCHQRITEISQSPVSLYMFINVIEILHFGIITIYICMYICVHHDRTNAEILVSSKFICLT